MFFSSSPNHPDRNTSRYRNGIMMVESALVLPILFIMLLTLLDLGIACVRYNALSHGARRIARFAIIHGSISPATSDKWGPTEYEGTAADSTSIVGSIKHFLPTMSPDKVSIRVTWPDADNTPRDRVTVELHYLHDPLVPILFPWGSMDLQSIATMCIVN